MGFTQLVVRVHAWLRRPRSAATAAVVALVFGLLHLPWPYLIAPTVIAGFVWSYAFLCGGRVWPLALSHAALAVAFFGFVVDRDPFDEIFGEPGPAAVVERGAGAGSSAGGESAD